MKRIGSWRVVKGESIADAIRKAAELCYDSGRVIDCVLAGNAIVPRFLLPAAIPADWKAEVNAMTRGEWR